MATLAKLPERMPCQFRLFGVDRDNFDVGFLKKSIKLASTSGASGPNALRGSAQQ